jgi:hypothetical protein
MEGRALVPKSSSAVLDEDDEDDAVVLSLPPPEAQETWYPTLRVTLWVLSCLYTYVDVSFLPMSLRLNSFCRPQYLMISLKKL